MDSSDEWYYKNYVLSVTSSDDSSDDESDGLVATLVVNKFIERGCGRCTEGRCRAGLLHWTRTGELANSSSGGGTTFVPTDPRILPRFSGVVSG